MGQNKEGTKASRKENIPWRVNEKGLLQGPGCKGRNRVMGSSHTRRADSKGQKKSMGNY